MGGAILVVGDSTDPRPEPAIRNCVLADYAAYVERQEHVSQIYRDWRLWTRKSILNAASVGKFSSDRTIREYAEKIWNVRPLPVTL